MTSQDSSTDSDQPQDVEQARAELDKDWQRAFDWIESKLGAKIVAFDRQARWRPAFFVEIEREGERSQLYLRGARGDLDHGVYPLEHESRVLQVLESEGILVPHVHGFCPDPEVIVMDAMPGRANLATSDDPKEREDVLNHYMDILADMHSIDPKRFEEIGIERPKGPEALGLMDFDRWEKNFQAAKVRPEPLIEFVTGWIRRNVPKEREVVSLLAVDAGQFLFDKGRVTSLLDLELACLGDPAADLGGMRGRDLAEPLGDLAPAFERYYAKRGDRIPKEIVDYHTVRFALCTPFTTAPLVAAPPETVDLCVYLGWHWVWARVCIEVIAHGRGLALEEPVIPDPPLSAYASAHDLLVNRLKALRDEEPAEGFLRYDLDNAWRNAKYLRNVERFGHEVEADETREIDAMLGRATTPGDREADFEAYVLEQGADHEEALLRFFYKRCVRQEALVGSSLRELEGCKMQMID